MQDFCYEYHDLNIKLMTWKLKDELMMTSIQRICFFLIWIFLSLYWGTTCNKTTRLGVSLDCHVGNLRWNSPIYQIKAKTERRLLNCNTFVKCYFLFFKCVLILWRRLRSIIKQLTESMTWRVSSTAAFSMFIICACFWLSAWIRVCQVQAHRSIIATMTTYKIIGITQSV